MRNGKIREHGKCRRCHEAALVRKKEEAYTIAENAKDLVFEMTMSKRDPVEYVGFRNLRTKELVIGKSKNVKNY